MSDYVCTIRNQRLSRRAFSSLAKLRDGVTLTGPQLSALQRRGLAFYDTILKRYRVEPLVLREFNRRCVG